MLMDKPKSISVKELNTQLGSAIQESLGKRKVNTALPGKFGLINNPGVLVGFILSSNEIDNIGVGELTGIASEINTQINGSSAQGAVALLHDGGATVGYYPVSVMFDINQ